MLEYEVKSEFFKKLATLYNIITEIHSKKNLTSASDKIISLLLDELDSMSCSIHLYTDGKLFLLSNRGKGCANDDIAITSDEETRLVRNEMPVESKDIFLYSNILSLLEKGSFSFSMLMPLVSGENLIGVIFLGKKTSGKGYTNDEKLFFAMICKQIAVVIHNSFLEREISRNQGQKTDLYIKSITDPLTGLYHRAHLEYRMREDLKVAKRYSRPFSALMIEIDYFFQISEMKGSQLTYHLVVNIAKTIEKAIRMDVDLPARYSVDTIVVLLPETVPQGAMVLAERIRSKISELHRTVEIPGFPEVTASIGVATLEDKEDNVEDIIGRLKDSLDKARSAGRNKVCICKKVPEEEGVKTFSTYEALMGMGNDLIIDSVKSVDASEVQQSGNAVGSAYRNAKNFQDDPILDELTEKNKNKDPKDNTLSSNSMKYLDMITEEEKEEKSEQKGIPSNKIKLSTSSSFRTVTKQKPVGKYDSIIAEKLKQRQLNKSATSQPMRKAQDQVHYLGFIDEV